MPHSKNADQLFTRDDSVKDAVLMSAERDTVTTGKAAQGLAVFRNSVFAQPEDRFERFAFERSFVQRSNFSIGGVDDFNRPICIDVPQALAREEFPARPCGEGR